MKKLFALAIVAGMMFVSCGSKTEEAPEQVDQDLTEDVQIDEQDDVIAMPEEEVAEEAE